MEITINNFSTDTFTARGLWRGVPEDVYRTIKALSGTELSALAKSPAHLKARRERLVEPTAAMAFGSLVHCALLEPKEIDKRYVVAPDCDKRTKAGKEAWAAFEASLNGKTIVKEDDLIKATQIQIQAHRDETTSNLLSGLPEVSLFWEDPFVGLCKGRIDCLIKNAGTPKYIIVDLKTSQDAMPHGFSGSCVKFGYGLQAAHYACGFEALTSIRPAYFFVVVEKEEPFVVQNYMCSDSFLDTSREHYNKLLETYEGCISNDSWPAPSTAIQTLDYPNWYLRENA